MLFHLFHQYCPTIENEIKANIESGKLKNDKKDDYLQTILLNRKIRDLLSQDIIIGVVGRIKQHCKK